MNRERLYSFLLRLLTPLGKALFRVSYSGAENIPGSGGFIVCSNHRSVFDPFLLAIPFRRQIRYMAKSELFSDHGRAARAFLYAMGAFPVRRNTADRRSVRTAEQILKSGGIVGIFPQGGCVFDNSPFRPKPGVALLAARTGAPVLPAAICCSGRVRPFRPVAIRLGSVIAGSRLPFRGTSVSGMREASERIAERINAMLEEKS